MVALDIEALATVGHGADEDRFERAEVVARVVLRSFGREVIAEVRQVEDARREVADDATFLMSNIAGHRESFEIDLRSHHGRTNVQHHAPFELRDGLGEDQKVGVRGGSGRSSIAVRMLVDDVLSDRDVDRDGDAESVSRRENAGVGVGKLLLNDHPSKGLTETDPVALSDYGRIVQSSGFFPQSELSLADILRDALTRLADQREFKVVNRTRSVQSQMREKTALHQVDQQRAVACAEHVPAADEHHGTVVLLGGDDSLSQDRQRGMLEGNAWTIRRDPDLVALQVVNAVGQRQNFEFAAVELREGHEGKHPEKGQRLRRSRKSGDGSEAVEMMTRTATSDTFPSGGRESSGAWGEESEDLRSPLGRYQSLQREVDLESVWRESFGYSSAT